MKLTLALLAAAGAIAVPAVLAAQDAPRPAAPGRDAESPEAAAPVAAAEARATAETLAAMLQESYVFPDVAARYAAALRAHAASGAYDELGTAGALAERLTADLRAVSPDNHLRVRPGQPRSPGAAPRPGGPGPVMVPVRRMIGAPAPAGAESPPPGPAAGGPRMVRIPMQPIEEARWLAPGIAYIRFNVFPGDPETVDAVRRFMAEHADAKAIIFDNRTHHGGGLAEMDAMFPYLFAKPTTLVTMDTRASVDRAQGSPMGDARLRLVPTREDVVRREHYVEPVAGEKRLFGAKVFVLTAPMTASAAEHMTLALKRTHRATIVGETTAGAGNYGGMRPIGDKFSVFIPVGRTFDPDTGKGWEGTGVAPDVAVPAEQALVEALVLSGVARPEAERLAADVKPAGPMRRPPPGS